MDPQGPSSLPELVAKMVQLISLVGARVDELEVGAEIDVEVTRQLERASSTLRTAAETANWHSTRGVLWKCAAGEMPGFPRDQVWQVIAERRSMAVLEDIEKRLVTLLAQAFRPEARERVLSARLRILRLIEEIRDHDSYDGNAIAPATIALLADELVADEPVVRSNAETLSLLGQVAPDTFFG